MGGCAQANAPLCVFIDKEPPQRGQSQSVGFQSRSPLTAPGLAGKRSLNTGGVSTCKGEEGGAHTLARFLPLACVPLPGALLCQQSGVGQEGRSVPWACWCRRVYGQRGH